MLIQSINVPTKREKGVRRGIGIAVSKESVHAKWSKEAEMLILCVSEGSANTHHEGVKEG